MSFTTESYCQDWYSISTLNLKWYLVLLPLCRVLPKNIKERRHSVQRPNSYQLIQARALGLLGLVTRHHTCFQVLSSAVCISSFPERGGVNHGLTASPSAFFFDSVHSVASEQQGKKRRNTFVTQDITEMNCPASVLLYSSTCQVSVTKALFCHFYPWV